MISNETQYDNQQLAQLQNELKDNQLYSGIGIIPGTDTGGSSEGGENGTSGGNQGGSGGSNTNTGGQPSRPSNENTGGGQVPGLTAKDPTIYVLAGEEIAASVYRSDVTLQILTPEEKTQKIKYVLNTTVDAINQQLYPTGLIRELDIENGGTLTLTREGEYTLTAYAYDGYGNKSNGTAIWLKISKNETELGKGISVTLTSGIEGKKGWYTSNVTYRVLGQDKGSTRVTYRVTGTAKSNGRIDKDYKIGELDTGEVDIANGTTFKIEVDGEFEIRAYTYDNSGTRLSELTEPIKVNRDASKPIIIKYTGNQEIKDNASESGFLITLNAQDLASNLASEKTYTYNHKLATVMDYTGVDANANETTKLYRGLEKDKTYDMYALVRDNAGNIATSDIIARPAIWVSSNPSIGESINNGEEGARVYYSSSNVDVSLKGQDKNNIDKQNAKIGKVTYQIIGTTTSDGQIDGKDGKALPTDEQEMENEKTIEFRADGNWEIRIHTYDEVGTRKVSTNTIQISRDTIAPEPPSFTASAITNGDEGQDGHYKGNIRITAHGSDDTSFKKITYQISGATSIGETDIEDGQTFDLPATDGTYNITGFVYDLAGRKSTISQTLTVVRDTKAPNTTTPTVTTANSADKGEVDGTTSYFKGDVTVQLNGGTDENDIIDRATCTITGTATKAGQIQGESIDKDKQVNKTIETTKNGTFNITADGRWTINTYTYDKAGNRSVANTIVVVKDTEGPSITSWELTEKGQKPKSLEMQVVAEDTLSSLATTGTYTYSIVTSPATADVTKTENIHNYTENLNIDTEYDVTVVVKDKAGNTTPSTNKVKTKNGYFLKDVAKVGDYVDYLQGYWTETKGAPASHGELGGVTAGNHTGTGLGGSDSGWYIQSIEDSGIILYSAGNPATLRVSNKNVPTYNYANHTGFELEVCFSNDHPSRHSNGTWTLQYGSCTNTTFSDGPYSGFTYVCRCGYPNQYKAHSCTNWEYYVDRQVYKQISTNTCGSGCLYTSGTDAVMTNHTSASGYGSGWATCLVSSKPATGATLNMKTEGLWWKYTSNSVHYSSGVKGVMLCCSVDCDVLTSGEKTSKFSTRMGWEII